MVYLGPPSGEEGRGGGYLEPPSGEEGWWIGSD